MNYLKLFENWYDNRTIKGRKDYSQINLDWSKFLKDVDYTFDIIKQVNPRLETQWIEPFGNYLTLIEGGELDDYHEIETIEEYENSYIKQPIKDYIKLFKKTKDRGYLEVTRILTVDDLSEIDFSKIGKYWSFCDNPSQKFDNIYKKQYIKLIAKARLDSIDWLNSLDNYVYYGDDECEITLREGASIFIEKMINDKRTPSDYKTKKDNKTFYNFTGNKETIDLNKKAKI